jgi:hypothetical protein
MDPVAELERMLRQQAEGKYASIVSIVHNPGQNRFSVMVGSTWHHAESLSAAIDAAAAANPKPEQG